MRTVGIDALNKMMQEILNTDGQNKQVRLNSFNGDMSVFTGIILAKDSDDKANELVFTLIQME